jgi:plastocyanin
VVYFRPAAGGPRAQPGRYSIVTRNKRFAPTTVVVPIGSTVVFPNQDEVLHNVFSESPGSEFDLGLYGEGETREVLMQRPGAVLVFCNVHYSMYAAVVVVDTPFHGRVGADGRFAIEGVPDGPGTLHVWHPRADPLAVPIARPATGAGTLDLAIVKPLIPEHQRLGGGSYAPVR